MYYANPQVSQWVAKYELFTNLEKDSILRVNNAILNTFYQTQQAQSIGQVRTTEQKLNLITDSLVYYDSLQFITKIHDAITSNNAITGSENYLVNERWTNALWIKITRFGYDTLDATEVADLETLAKSCPAVEGLSVYKARMLYTYYEPLFDYDDYDLCSNASKGMAGMYDSLLYFLQNPNQVPEKKNTMGINQLLVYPNPAGKDINIAYNFEGDDDAVFQLFDVLGRMQLQTTLPNNLNQIQLHLTPLQPGFYSYRVTSGKQQFYGKLLIK